MRSVTIIIPTFNGMSWLQDSIHAFLEQDYPGKWEIVAIDSGSTDGTVDFLEQFERITVHQIPQESFGHGTTRNLGVSLATSDLLLFTVQDATPRTPDWLTHMVRALEFHELDGVCGGQAVPHHPDKNPIQWYRPIAEDATVEVFTSDDFQRASPNEKLKMCSWDNVNALYRKTALVAQPFKVVRFGEDMAWARDVLNQGGRIGYAKSLKVWHYHHQHVGFTRKRQIYTHYWRHRIFGVLPESGQRIRCIQLRWLKGLVFHAGIGNPITILKWMRYNRMIRQESTQANSDFLKAAKAGPEELSNLYESFGEKPPMATK
jgi:rhamnosyltransferase